jgi:hypothetical protein
MRRRSTAADEMHDLEDVSRLHANDRVFGPGDHLPISLDGDRPIREPEVLHEPHHREPGGHVPNFSVDGQTHAFYVCVSSGGCQ